MLLNEIHKRGHKIGVHPGYGTFNNSIQFGDSINEFKKVLNDENIVQSDLGGRQHYLRWDCLITADMYEKNGLKYDSTLSYADKAGFRCGVCYDFYIYDLLKKKK